MNSTLQNTAKKKPRRISYVLRSGSDMHNSGINAFAVKGDQAVLTAGRDATIREWSYSSNRHEPTFVGSFEGHSDWVNDVTIGSGNVFSCSSDCTVRIWDAKTRKEKRTLQQHKDYVKCLAYSKQTKKLVTGGFDGTVCIWDVEASLDPTTVQAKHELSISDIQLQTTTTPESSRREPGHERTLQGHKDSVYCVAMNPSSTVVASGSPEKVIRIWDPRIGSKVCKLKGHSDNIRSVLLQEDGTMCISGSSDCSIKIWDLRQQRCLNSFDIHDDSVWSVAASEDFSTLFSAGRDGNVFATNLSSEACSLLVAENQPVLKVASTSKTLWTCTVKNTSQWKAEDLRPRCQAVSPKLSGLGSPQITTPPPSSFPPVNSKPLRVIKTLPWIVKHEILNNKRQVLTKDSADSVCLWDITKGELVVNYGVVDFEETLKDMYEEVSVPSWFSMDTKIGCITVHLSESTFRNAEVYASDAGFPSKELEDQKVNMGEGLLRAMLSSWIEKRRAKQIASDAPEHPEPPVEVSYKLSTDTPLVISENDGNGPSLRILLGDFTGNEDDTIVPAWAMEIALNKVPPKEHPKYSFYLTPSEEESLPQVTQSSNKLSAPRILPVRKIASYVVNRLSLVLPQQPGSNQQILAHEYFDIMCKGKVLASSTNLAAIKTFYWKSSEDIQLHFRRKESYRNTQPAFNPSDGSAANQGT